MKGYKIFRFEVNKSFNEMLNILSMEPPVRYSTYFEGEQVHITELYSKFTDVRQEGDEIWGRLKYEVDRTVVDLQGTVYSGKGIEDVEFVIVDGKRQFLIAFRGRSHANMLANTLNKMLNPQLVDRSY